ncbi:MAG TPA: DegT/DnrJ/EryC1/StrS family aminotransferase [Solirubrobacterales bacterium]|jgi:dTDP-4-amino-4,6-dideoxygalactose transaminase|nr:DegT/DnrJ/EryC1/StrS family aminotransferase [Solirubrobacterales bacterium]
MTDNAVADVPLARPEITDSEERAVIEALRSGWVSEGPEVARFEQSFAALVGTRHAVAVNSCTSALFLTLLASGIKGEVLVPSYTWAATANAVVAAGATPVWVDIEDRSFGMSPADAATKLTPATEAIVCVHLAGHACQVEALAALADEHSLLLVEDAAQTLGGLVGDRQVGSFGVGCFSFFATKAITTGDGGMVTTDDEGLASAIRRRSRHGVATGSVPWHREALEVGFNMRMPNVLAALGRAQLDRLDEMNLRRRSAADALTRLLAPCRDQVRPPIERPGFTHVYQMYLATLTAATPRDELVLALRRRGIEASVHFTPAVHRQAAYRDRWASGSDSLPVTEDVCERAVTLPIHPGISEADLDRVAVATADSLQEVSSQ